jgi:hypothetical protein
MAVGAASRRDRGEYSDSEEQLESSEGVTAARVERAERLESSMSGEECRCRPR